MAEKSVALLRPSDACALSPVNAKNALGVIGNFVSQKLAPEIDIWGDTSGSMVELGKGVNGEYTCKSLVPAVANGAKEVAESGLNRGARVRVSHFSSTCVHLTGFSDKPEEIHQGCQKLGNIKPDGATNMEPIFSGLNENTHKRIIVIASDGVPDRKERILALASEAKNNGHKIITVPIGTEVDLEFMNSIASPGFSLDRVEKTPSGIERGFTLAANLLLLPGPR